MLVVDDYEDGREMVAWSLEAAGFDVVRAAGGAEAVDQAKRWRPAAIVTDIFMPDVDGVEATRRIKAEPDLKTVPVIAYTAWPERVASTDLFHSICPKPCPPDKLIALVHEALAA